MILEIADIRVRPGSQAAFADTVVQGIQTIVAGAHGFRGYKLNRGIESPERFVLMIFWETLEDHTAGFRQSPAFAAWRALVGPHFATPPMVEHFDLLARSS